MLEAASFVNVTARSLSVFFIFFIRKKLYHSFYKHCGFPLPAAAETIMPLPRSLMALSLLFGPFCISQLFFSPFCQLVLP